MRKAGLLDRKPLTATRKMLGAARKDKGTVKEDVRSYGTYSYTEYESRFYFRAALSADKKILETDLFTRKDLAAGRKEPRFRIFLDRGKEDFISWDMVEEKWSRAKIDMLDTGDGRYCYSYRGRNHASKETLNTVNRYLGTGCMQDVEEAVLVFQAKVRKHELSRKHRLEMDAIDAYMDTVPAKLPADWMKFINDRTLEHSIFYEKEKKTGYCTHCRLSVPVPPDVRHNMPGRCRQCGSSVTYKSWRMQEHTTYRTAAALLQKCTDGEHFVYRQFRVDMYTERGRLYVPEILVHEDYRQIFRAAGTYGTAASARRYEWGRFKSTGIDRWCEASTVNYGGYLGWDYSYTGSVLYTGNIKRLLKGTGLECVPAAEIIKSMGRERINVMAALGDMQGRFPYEVFWKMGLKRFVRERIGRGGTQGLARTGDSGGSLKPWEYIKLTKEGMKQAVRLDATDRQVRVLQKAVEAGVALTDGQALWFDKYMGVHTVMDYFTVQTPHRIMRYLQEKINVEPGDAKYSMPLHLWTDYLDMARQLGWDLHDRVVFFPQDIQRAHDEAAVLFTMWKDKAKAEEMKEKDAKMNRIAKEAEKVFCYRNDEYMISVPGCFLDFKKEGNAQHNCVATYYERVLEGKCTILFIRRRKNPKKPFCTVEVRSDMGKFAIMQNRTACNKDAPEGAREFIKKAVKEAQKIADRMAAGGRKKDPPESGGIGGEYGPGSGQ